MIRNYFALYALAREMSERFEGGYVFECFSQEKGELRVSLFAPSKERFAIVGATGETRLALYFSEDFARKKRNVASLFAAANDRQIQRVHLSERDRVLYFELEGNLRLVFQLFSADTNFFLVQDGLILEAFKKNDALKGAPFVESSAPPILPTLERLAQDETRLKATLESLDAHALDEKRLQKELPRLLPGFDATLAREVLFRAKEQSPSIDIRSLCDVVSELFYELISPDPKVYRGLTEQGETTHWFSIIDERHRPFQAVERFESVNEAMKFYSFKVHQAERFGKELKTLRAQLSRLIEKTRAQIAAMQEQSAKNRAEECERQGQLLMANLHRIEKGMSEITVEDFFNGGRLVIALDPKKSPYENAEAYFEKAKKSKASAVATGARLKSAQENLSTLHALQAELSGIGDQKTFAQWRKANLTTLRKFLLVSKEEAEKQTLFRRFRISPSAELWVGKNAKNNDLLTFKYARPNDLWFHARGVAGSHCVLKSSKPPTREELERAAAIAAHYSDAKGSELAPVICVPKKYVRKPKGADVGAVVVEREEVLLVKPRLWAEESED